MNGRRLLLKAFFFCAAGWIFSFFGLQAGAEVKYFRIMDEIEIAAEGAGMRYALFVPQTYKAQKPAPLILALHFGGTVTPTYGKDFAEVLILPALSDLEAIIVAPNCPGRGWTDAASEDAVLKLLDRVKQRFTIDPKRVVVTGFSMGAIGTFHFAAKYPELFSAAVAVSGIPDPDDLSLLKDVPFFVIQSADDEVFPIEKARNAFGKMKSQGVNIKTDIIQNISHYRTPEFVPALKKAVSWLLEVWRNQEKTK